MRWLPDEVVARLRLTTEDTLSDEHPRYRRERLLARGGMGEVYQAQDLSLGRTVAMKVLRSDLSTPEAARRMEREARLLAQLEHPNIVPLHDSGTLADGRFFVILRFVQGQTLTEYAEEPSTRTERLRLFLRVCDAVAYAHSRGVIHRDLKPANIMVGPFGEVFVMDWGIATLIDAGAGEGTHREDMRPRGLADVMATPSTAGTPGYQAPEHTTAPASVKLDLYALGVVLRELVSRESTSQRDRIPNRLQAIMNQAAHPDPGYRYDSASELSRDVSHFLDGDPVSAYRERWWEHATRWARNNEVLMVLLAVYFVVKLAIFFLARR